ncbi:MAG TPA: serine hydrolase domain-containing protein [Bryobacteraceae bacterium]|nr:serine hydrolase domain-containing protein [Bryobacteraceae bacterium]
MALPRFDTLPKIFLWLITAAAVAAQTEEAGVDAIFAPYRAAGSPGCAVGVLQNGRTALAKGYGLADLEQNIPITPQSRFYMASVSKQFTSLALLLAEADGKLRLDKSIRTYIPELPVYAETIPLYRALDHTAGFRDFLSLWDMRGYSNESVLREAPSFAMIARQRALNFEPGSQYSYSNSGYLLAAIALQRATGKPLAEFARDRIFTPLGMRASAFQADHSAPIPRRAHGYRKSEGAWKTTDVNFDVTGSGGLYSNIEDMLRWARNFEEPVVGKELLTRLQTPGHLADGRPTPGGYALGIIKRDGTYSHSGGANGYSTFFLRVPERRLTIICLCNIGAAGVDTLASRVAAVYGATFRPAVPAPPIKPLPTGWKQGEQDALAGSYWSEELHAVWQLQTRNGALWLETDGASLPVHPQEGGGYRAGLFQLRAESSANGPVTAFTATVDRARGVSFVRR